MITPNSIQSKVHADTKLQLSLNIIKHWHIYIYNHMAKMLLQLQVVFRLKIEGRNVVFNVGGEIKFRNTLVANNGKQ